MVTNDIYSVLILTIMLVMIVFVGLKKKRRIDFFLLFNITYAVFFGIVPILIIFNPELLYYGRPANWAYHFDAYKYQLIRASIYALMFYLFFAFFYKLLSTKRFISVETQEKAKYVNQNTLFIFGIGFLLFGIVSFFIYSTTTGGPVNAVIYAQLSRSGVYEHSGVVTFFKHFMKSVYFGLFIFMTALPSRKSFKSIKKFFLVLSIIFTIIVLLVYSGRANIVMLLVAILFYQNVINDRIFLNRRQVFKYIQFILIFGVISAFFRPFMLMLSGRDVVFETTDVFMEMYTSIIKGFSVPMISMMVALEKFTITEITMGTGFLQIFIDIIPKSIINPASVYKINNLNTELFGFILDSRMYNINSGLLAYFYYEFHWFGVIIGSMVTALIIKISDDLLKYLKESKTIAIMMTYFLFNLPNRILAGDQVGGIKSFLILYLEFLLVVMLIRRTKLANKTKESIYIGQKYKAKEAKKNEIYS